MLYRTALLGLGLFTVVGNAIAAQSAASTVPLKPSGPWNVEYAGSICVLQRDFGPVGDRVTLGFKPSPAGDGILLVLVTPQRKAKFVDGVAQIDFDGRSALSDWYSSYPIKDKNLTVTTIYLKRSELAALPTARTMQIKAGDVHLVLSPNRVSDAFKALDACEVDLLATWGMDPKIISQIAQYPTAGSRGTAGFFSANDYPSSALARNEQGTAGVRLKISTDGKASECFVVETSGSKTLDDATCNIFQRRGRFQPARLRDGQTVESFTYSRIRWEIPD